MVHDAVTILKLTPIAIEEPNPSVKSIQCEAAD